MNSPGEVFVIGIGPGRRDLMTPQAAEAIRRAEVVIGYVGYFAWVDDLVGNKERVALPLGQERERASAALEHAGQGRRVAVVCSGDPGIYAMAGLVMETLQGVPEDAWPEITVVPGVSALNAAAALLGAPLGHDFAVVSLSDLLTPWEIIEKRLAAAAEGDFVLALFNPRSRQRDWQLARAREIMLQQRAGETPVGIVHNAFRPGQTVGLTTLADLKTDEVDIFTIVIIGNSTSRLVGPYMVTPRGYAAVTAGEER
jgi:precorrin-3B C17-methyltransferase